MGFKEWLNEANYVNREDAFNAFLTGKLNVKDLTKVADKLGTQIATKPELEMFLKNKFMQNVMSDTYKIPSNVLVKKVKELMKHI